MPMVYQHFPSAGRTGAAATEFALSIPLLMLLALGALDVGRVSYYAEAVSNAARTGAERGAMQRFTSFTRPMWEAAIGEAVVQEMQNLPDFDEGRLEYLLTVTTEPGGVNRIAVEVAYPFQTVVSWPALPSEILLRKRIQFRQFR